MNFNIPSIPNISVPKFENPLEAKTNCKHLSYCEKLQIITDDCLIGANLTRRCRQPEFANIILLSKLLDQSQNKE